MHPWSVLPSSFNMRLDTGHRFTAPGVGCPPARSSQVISRLRDVPTGAPSQLVWQLNIQPPPRYSRLVYPVDVGFARPGTGAFRGEARASVCHGMVAANPRGHGTTLLAGLGVPWRVDRPGRDVVLEVLRGRTDFVAAAAGQLAQRAQVACQTVVGHKVWRARRPGRGHEGAHAAEARGRREACRGLMRCR